MSIKFGFDIDPEKHEMKNGRQATSASLELWDKIKPHQFIIRQ